MPIPAPPGKIMVCVFGCVWDPTLEVIVPETKTDMRENNSIAGDQSRVDKQMKMGEIESGNIKIQI